MRPISYLDTPPRDQDRKFWTGIAYATESKRDLEGGKQDQFGQNGRKKGCVNGRKGSHVKPKLGFILLIPLKTKSQ
tara:strand:- start:142 stop:369 length:228 start_codon:yes stop_codon:yes gene_type:complete